MTKINKEIWEPCENCNSCLSCKYSIDSSDIDSVCFWCNNYKKFVPQNFCPDCGRPLTDEGWKLLKKRLEAME